MTEGDSLKPSFLSDKVYDMLKYVTMIALPAFGALYFGLAELWGLPYADEVTGTIVAVVTFLGVLLGISTARYNKSDSKYDGDMVPTEMPDGALRYNLQLNQDQPEDLEFKRELRFRVQPRPYR